MWVSCRAAAPVQGSGPGLWLRGRAGAHSAHGLSPRAVGTALLTASSATAWENSTAKGKK